jgi:hypothetical protein
VKNNLVAGTHVKNKKNRGKMGVRIDGDFVDTLLVVLWFTLVVVIIYAIGATLVPPLGSPEAGLVVAHFLSLLFTAGTAARILLVWGGSLVALPAGFGVSFGLYWVAATLQPQRLMWPPHALWHVMVPGSGMALVSLPLAALWRRVVAVPTRARLKRPAPVSRASPEPPVKENKEGKRGEKKEMEEAREDVEGAVRISARADVPTRARVKQPAPVSPAPSAPEVSPEASPEPVKKEEGTRGEKNAGRGRGRGRRVAFSLPTQEEH